MVLEGQNLELSVRNISEKGPETKEEAISCSVKVKFRDLESLLSSLYLIQNTSPTLGNFQHSWTSNLDKPFRSENQAPLYIGVTS